MSGPLVTVLMSVHNGEAYLSEAVESILSQTYQNFEFLIVNDASTDRSASILVEYQDARIRIIRNEHNLGLTRSLNKGLAQVKGKYVARMDADDVSYPLRLERQVTFMEQHPEVGLCGTWGKLLGLKDKYNRTFPTNNNELQVSLLCYNPFIHPSVVLRSDVLRALDKPYDQRFRYAQDYELWTRVAERSEITNLPETLVGYRVHEGQISSHRRQEQDQCVTQVVQTQLKKLGIEASPQEARFARHVLSRSFPYQATEAVQRAHEGLLQLKAANERTPRYHPLAFRQYLDESWAQLIANLHQPTKETKKLVQISPFRIYRSLTIRERVRLFTKLAFL